MDYETSACEELQEMKHLEKKRNRRTSKTVESVRAGWCYGCDSWITWVGQKCPICGRNETPKKLKDY